MHSRDNLTVIDLLFVRQSHCSVPACFEFVEFSSCLSLTSTGITGMYCYSIAIPYSIGVTNLKQLIATEWRPFQGQTPSEPKPDLTSSLTSSDTTMVTECFMWCWGMVQIFFGLPNKDMKT